MIKWLSWNRHKVIGYLWIVSALPVYIWFRDSVFVVLLMSIYANAEASFGAQHAKDSERQSKEE